MAILETLLAAGGGSLTGSVAGVATAYFENKLAQARLPLEIAQLEAQVEIAKHERREAADAQEQESYRTEINAGTDSLIAAHESDKASYGIKWIDGVRGMVRPLITGWCIYILSDMTVTLWAVNGDNIDLEFWKELFKHLVVSWTYLTTTAVMYWFGSRGGRAPRLR